MKNQTDRFSSYRLPDAVFVLAKLGARERHGMLGLDVVTFVIPKSPEQDPRLFCRNRGPRQVSGLNAGPRRSAPVLPRRP